MISSQRDRDAQKKDVEIGASRLAILLIVLIAVCCVYAGSQIFPFYYSYWELQGLMEAQAKKASELTDEEIRKTLEDEIKKLGIPIDNPEDLRIDRVGGRIEISLKYEEVFYVDFGKGRDYDIYVFPFHAHAEADLE